MFFDAARLQLGHRQFAGDADGDLERAILFNMLAEEMANIDMILSLWQVSVLEVRMALTLKLSLTDELRSFIEENCGDGTLYATPSEFVCDLLRQKKLKIEAARVHDAIVAGYQDAIDGRVTPFEGNVRSLLKEVGK